LAFTFFFLCWTYGIAVPSGLFVPAQIIGFLIGRLVGIFANHIWSRNDLHMVSFVFLGGVAGLAAFTRMTISVTVIAMEACSNGNSFLVALGVAVTSKLIADSLSMGIYDLHIQLKGIPYLEPRATEADLYFNLRVVDIMSPRVVSVPVKVHVWELLLLLRTHSFNSFPVTKRLVDSASSRTYSTIKGSKSMDFPPRRSQLSTEATADALVSVQRKSPRFVGIIDTKTHTLRGMISRRILIALLKNISWFRHTSEPLQREKFDPAWPNDRIEHEENEILANIELQDMELLIDLGYYVDPNPSTIALKGTAYEARELLRSTGARHALAVQLRTGSIVGILTRKDVLPETLRDTLERKNREQISDP